MSALTATWRRRGHELGLGVGIALGYATLSTIGFEGRFDYSPIGSIVNLASRLCDAARDGQILVNQRLYGAVEDLVAGERLPDLVLKGFVRPVSAFNIVALREQEASDEGMAGGQAVPGSRASG